MNKLKKHDVKDTKFCRTPAYLSVKLKHEEGALTAFYRFFLLPLLESQVWSFNALRIISSAA